MNTPSTISKKKNHFYWLDIFRGIAAFSVLIWHYQQFYSPEADVVGLTERSVQPFYSFFKYFYHYGNSAVQFFWVISGFVFAATYFEKQAPIWKKFMIHRVSRLYPLHFITLIVVAVLQIINLELIGKYQIYANNDLYHFVLNLFLIPYWGFQKGYSFNAPIWSVSVEVVIYFIFFICLPLILKKERNTLLTILAVLILLLVTKSKILVFWRCGLFFFLGCLIFHLWKRYSHLPKKLLSLSILGIFSGIFMGTFWPEHINGTLQHLILYPAIVMFTAAIDSFDKLSLGPKGKLLGDLSFGIYLWHVPVQLFLILWLEISEKGRMIANEYWFFALFIVSTFTVSYLSFRFFELPMQKKIRSFI